MGKKTMEKEINERFCKGKKFLNCMFINRNWDCNKESCPLSKNKTKDVKKHIERIIKEAKLQGLREAKALYNIEIDKFIKNIKYNK